MFQLSPRPLLLIAGLLCGVVAGCDDAARSRGSVVVYVSHDLTFSQPILKDFERRSGIEVRIVGDTEANKTTGLARRLVELKDRPEADVFWNNEVMRTVQLADLGVLATWTPESAVGIPTAYCDPAGRWVGFGARARVILYNNDLVAPQDAPRSIFDLTDERYRGKVVIAKPLFGTTATHVAALFVALGADRAKAFLTALKANDVIVADGNAMARNMVRDGQAPICLTDTDDANGALTAGRPVTMVYPDQEEGGIGTLVIPNTVALVKGAPNPAAGRRLVEFLASREVEARLAASKSAQMPLRPDVAVHSPQFDLAEVRAMEIDWGKVAAAVDESSAFVREVFLR